MKGPTLIDTRKTALNPTEGIAALAPLLQSLIARMEAQVPYAAILVTDEAGERVRAGSTEEQVGEITPSRGAVISVHTGHGTIEASVDVLTEAALTAAADQVVARSLESGLGDHAPDPGPTMTQSFFTPEDLPYDAVPLADKLARARSFRDRAHANDTRVVNAFGMVSHTRSRELFVNRAKTLFQDLRRTQAVVGVTLTADGHPAALIDGRGRRGGWEAAELPDGLIDQLVKDCGSVAGAPRLKAGYYDCIFSPEFSGIFAHEAFGHGTEADMFLKKRSKGEEFLGQPVAAPTVNMYDDPDLPDAAASYHFDHEGQLASRTQILEKGVLVKPITDMHTAHTLGIPRTANGRRESFSRKAYTRMSNTFFGTGDHGFDAMLADIEYGFYLERPSNGMEDPKNWGIQLEGHMASEIVNGKLTGRVFSPVIVTGYVPELLKSITMVGKEREITGLGMCGKGYKEWVKVTDGGPLLRLKARLA